MRFNLKSQIRHMAEKQVLLDVVGKVHFAQHQPDFAECEDTSGNINFPPQPTSAWVMCLKS